MTIDGGGGVSSIGTEDSILDDFLGLIDEVRVSTVARTTDWIAAQHLSMTDAFITYNAEEVSTASCP